MFHLFLELWTWFPVNQEQRKEDKSMQIKNNIDDIDNNQINITL